MMKRLALSVAALAIAWNTTLAQTAYQPTGYTGTTYAQQGYGNTFNLKAPTKPAQPKLLKQYPFSQYRDGGKADNYVATHPGSIHDHYRLHGVRDLNYTGVVENGNALTFASVWGNTPAGQVPDFDNHVLLQSGYGPYVRVGTQYVRSDQPFTSASELTRRIDTGQFLVIFNNGTAQARLNQETGGIPTVPNPTSCIYTAGNCEEVRISGNLPTGTYSQTLHNYNQRNLTTPSAAYTTMVAPEGRVIITDVKVDGTTIGTHNGNYYVSGSLTNQGDKSPRIDVTVANLGFDPHAQGSMFTLKWVRWAKEQDWIAASNRQKINTYNRQLATYYRDEAIYKSALVKWKAAITADFAAITEPTANSTAMTVSLPWQNSNQATQSLLSLLKKANTYIVDHVPVVGKIEAYFSNKFNETSTLDSYFAKNNLPTNGLLYQDARINYALRDFDPFYNIDRVIVGKSQADNIYADRQTLPSLALRSTDQWMNEHPAVGGVLKIGAGSLLAFSAAVEIAACPETGGASCALAYASAPVAADLMATGLTQLRTGVVQSSITGQLAHAGCAQLGTYQSTCDTAVNVTGTAVNVALFAQGVVSLAQIGSVANYSAVLGNEAGLIGKIANADRVTFKGAQVAAKTEGVVNSPSQAIRINATAGKDFEDAYFIAKTVSKNTEPVSVNLTDGRVVTIIPDVITSGCVQECKNVINLSLSTQLQGEIALAEQTGRTFTLVISPRTETISGPLLKAIGDVKGEIVQFDPATGLSKLVPVSEFVGNKVPK